MNRTIESIQVGNGEGLTEEQEKRYRVIRIIADFASEVSDKQKIQMMRGKHIDIYLEAERVILARGDWDTTVKGIHPNTPGFSFLCYIMQERCSTPVRFTVKDNWSPWGPVVTKLITISKLSINYGQKKDTFDLIMKDI